MGWCAFTSGSRTAFVLGAGTPSVRRGAPVPEAGDGHRQVFRRLRAVRDERDLTFLLRALLGAAGLTAATGVVLYTCPTT